MFFVMYLYVSHKWPVLAESLSLIEIIEIYIHDVNVQIAVQNESIKNFNKTAKPKDKQTLEEYIQIKLP